MAMWANGLFIEDVFFFSKKLIYLASENRMSAMSNKVGSMVGKFWYRRIYVKYE